MMRIAPTTVGRPHLNATPFANLSLLVFSVVVIGGMFTAARGPGLRFATSAEAGPFERDDVVRVTLQAGGALAIEGEAIAGDELAARIAARQREHPRLAVALVVSPDADYGAMLEVYGALAALPGAPRLALPTRGWVESTGAE